MNWERARSKKQKAERIKTIVSTTAELYNSLNYEEITFALISKKSNFTRSNLYKYFTSKEEIFLELIKADADAWTFELKETFSEKTNLSVEEFSNLWTKILIKHKRMLDLNSILYTFLEKKSSTSIVIAYKTKAKDVLGKLILLLCSLFPKLNQEKATDFILIQNALACGLYPMANLHAAQEEILKAAEFQILKISFSEKFETSIRYLLKGLLA